ncbi:MAG TPA: DinB family protein [Ktedonobacteraceae bacterium]|jgi:hypothetical protein|nr:DinB family protein [Ktedonobacteraceae bacterium]
MNKTALLHKMDSKKAELENLVTSLNEAQLNTPGVNDNWSVKDNLAHITSWQHYLLQVLQGALRNQEPVTDVPPGESEDEENEQLYQQNKSRSFDEILTDFRATHGQIVEAVQSLSEEDLFDPRRFLWRQGRSLESVIEGNTYGHYDEHLQIMRRWLEQTENR